MTEPSDILKHFGIRGMHWGVRKNRDNTPDGTVEVGHKPGSSQAIKVRGGRNYEPTEDAKTFAARKQVAAKSGTQALTTKELREMVDRMNLEQQYSKLTTPQGKTGIAKGKANVDQILSYADTYNKIMNLPGMSDARKELAKDLGVEGLSLAKGIAKVAGKK